MTRGLTLLPVAPERAATGVKPWQGGALPLAVLQPVSSAVATRGAGTGGAMFA